MSDMWVAFWAYIMVMGVLAALFAGARLCLSRNEAVQDRRNDP